MGRSVTLVGEADRKMLKAVIKHSTGEDRVRHRVIPVEAVVKWVEKLEGMKGEIAEILQEEKEEKHVLHFTGDLHPLTLPNSSSVKRKWN